MIRLERNYRSGGHILAVASGLIAHNQGRLGKTLFTDAPMGERPTVTGVWDSQEEARVVGDAIEAAQREGVSLDDIAILVRASFQMREFEERFIAMGLPYKVIGGPRFYERAEIRDALAYLRCVAQPDDDLAFERIYNQPKRGLGEATLAILHEFGRRAGVSLMRAAQMLIETEELKARPRQLLRDLLASFDRWRKRSEEMPHEELAQLVLEESGYIDMWKAERTPDAAGRLDNLKELVRSMGEFPDLGAFLEHVSLVMDVESADGGERVSIMTLHAAKGLEFDLVFLPGWEEGLFPQPAGARRQRPGRPRGGAPPRLCRPHPRPARGEDHPRRQPARARPVAELRAVAVHRRTAARPCRGRGDGEGAAAFGGYGVRGSTRPASAPATRRRARGGRRPGPGARRLRPGFGRGPVRQIEGRAITLPAGGAFAEGARVFHLKFGPGSVVAVGRAEAHHRFRPGRAQARDGELRHAGAITGA